LILELPPFNEQQSISSILSGLDDKIDLLQRQNKTLEQLAETLFRQWFVEEAEESKIRLGDVIKTSSGGTPSRSKMEYYFDGTIRWVKSKELEGGFIFETEEMITVDAVKESSAKLFPENTILIAMYGATVGEYGILAESATCNQAICALIPNENYPYTFLFILTKMNKQNLINRAVGSAQQNISQELIQQLEIPKSIGKIRKFHVDVEPMFQKIKANSIQINQLTQLRDILLPKLMSGEVRLKN
jgi:type I restriction enzyme S subunit